MVSIFFENLRSSPFANFILPFLLVFAIIYGLLSKLDLFKKEDAEKDRSKQINLGIALVIGLIFASVSLASDCLHALLPKFAIALAVILVLYLLIGFFVDLDNKKSFLNIILSILALGAFLFILFLSADVCGIKTGSINLVIGSWWKWVVGFLIFFGLVAWMAKGSGNSDKDSKGTSLKENNKPNKVESNEEPEPY